MDPRYINIIDLESTCWEGDPPPNQKQEIIEIGICVLDVKKEERVEKRSVLVQPEFSTISPFCTKLTTLTQDQVDKGLSFKEAIKILKNEYDSFNRTWSSYGDFDRKMFERQVKYYPRTPERLYPFGPRHINIKNTFAVKNKLEREVGLDKALQLLGLPLEGTHHRGDDDAWNIGMVFIKTLWG